MLVVAASLIALIAKLDMRIFELPTIITVGFKKGTPRSRMAEIVRSVGLPAEQMHEEDSCNFVFSVKDMNIPEVCAALKDHSEVAYAEQYFFHASPIP